VAVRCALAPDDAPTWAADAIRDGGGELVDIAEAEALVWMGAAAPERFGEHLGRATKARWVQLPFAGIEPYVDLLERERVWTCGKGVYAEPVAEHALTLALAGLRDLPARMRATAWGAQSGISLYDRPVTILGGGGITECLLDLLTPMRCDVTVVRRRPAPMPGAARVVGPDGLHDALPRAQVVFVALALTPETEGVISAPELRLMESDAWLVNVARGRHVVTGDLVTALRERWIGGAALDVTDPEPLPRGHPLWGVGNCIITPHTANTFEMARPMLSARIRENVRRWGAGEPLIGLVDLELGY